MPACGRPESGGGEPRLEHVGAAAQDRLVERVQGVGVEKRQRREQDIAFADSERARGIDAPPKHLRLRAAYALGGAGGARGVEDRDWIPGPDRGGGGALPRGPPAET